MRLDYNNEPPKRIIDFYGLKINLTHEEGDRRFNLAPPLTCGYGSIRRTFGKGADKKSIDVYVGNDLTSNKVYRVTQLNGKGLFDEYKYIIGVKRLIDAEIIYRRNVPLIYFGGIQEVPIAELEEMADISSRSNDSSIDDPIEVTDSELNQIYLSEFFNFDAAGIDKKSSKVQSVLFDKNKWNESSAMQWMTDHKMNAIKISSESEDAEYIHVRLIDPQSSLCKEIRTIDFSKAKGIKARVCIP